MRIAHLTLPLVFIFVVAVNGQEDCSFKLTKAQKQYDAGQIEQIQQMLQPCIENGFTKEEKQTAQKLIIQANLFDRNMKSADSAMGQFLKKYPEYEILPADQAEFVQLFETYHTKPVAAVGGIIGVNYASAVNTDAFNQNTVGAKYTAQMGLMIGASFSKPILNKYELSLDVVYQQNKFQYTAGKSESNTTTTLDETQTFLMVPLTLIYTPLTVGKLSVFARAGAAFGYSLGSLGAISVIPEAADGSTPKLSDLALDDIREPIQVFGIIGAGATLKIPHSYIQFDVKYNVGFQNMVSKNIDPSKNSSYDFPLNGFRLSNLAFNIGYMYKFYSPRKK
jgi:hypothetical protein